MTVKYTQSENRAITIGNALVAGKNATATIDAECQTERKARKGKEVGTIKTGDVFMLRIQEVLIKAKWKEQSIKNALTTVRKAVNKGDKFSLNPYRDATKKGAKSTKSNETGVKLVIKGTPSAEEVSKALREIFNATGFRDKYAELASFMIDTLDEYDGE
jgi:hypothetical protein